MMRADEGMSDFVQYGLGHRLGRIVQYEVGTKFDTSDARKAQTKRFLALVGGIGPAAQAELFHKAKREFLSLTKLHPDPPTEN